MWLLPLCVVVAVLLSLRTSSASRDGESDQINDNDERQGEENLLLHTLLAAFLRRENDDAAAAASLFDPLQADLDCDDGRDDSCRYRPPDSTVAAVGADEAAVTAVDASCRDGGGGGDSYEPPPPVCRATTPRDEEAEDATVPVAVAVDKHWGSDPTILRMRDQLRQTGSGCSTTTTAASSSSTPSGQPPPGGGAASGNNRRPPIFLLPGLASTRLVAWRYQACPHHPLLSDIRVQDHVWLNLNLMLQMSTIDASCLRECLRLGRNQSDTDDVRTGCKLRPDEGLDAISSLSPGGIMGSVLVGGTNTVYAWLIQWCADNLGYDVSNIIGLPYDWRLSPDRMERRDGFLTLTRRRIEAAVHTSGAPGIMVAHSMGNTVFRYFLRWLRRELRAEAYQRLVREAQRRATAPPTPKPENATPSSTHSAEHAAAAAAASPLLPPGWMQPTTVGGGGGAAVAAAAAGARPADALWARAVAEGDAQWSEWIEAHIWTYVGLSAPLLGAVNPLRAVISGENMGLPVTDPDARAMELTFGSTHTVNPISSKHGFCDQWEIRDRWDEEATEADAKQHADSKLACLDDILTEIEVVGHGRNSSTADPWRNFPALKSLLRDRVDWDTNFPMIRVIKETCGEKEKRPCAKNSTVDLGPRDAESGHLFTTLHSIWKEENDPLLVKREQLRESFWETDIPNILNQTWERPLIKHVIMAYGVDLPTEAAYEYVKTSRENPEQQDAPKFDGIPTVLTALWETAGGALSSEHVDTPKAKLTDFWKKKKRRVPLRDGRLPHSGDGSVPYLSLAWSHTWLLHAVRARRHAGDNEGGGGGSGSSNPLDDIEIRHRPEGDTAWVDGPPPPQKITAAASEKKKIEESSDTGTAHPHGTKYKPAMVRYHNQGTSRTTGIEYTTTVIEALAVEHKETTRSVSQNVTTCRNPSRAQRMAHG